MHGLTEKHKRERTALSAASTTPYSRFLDRATLAAGIIGPLMTLPQIFKIYFYHQASGVSALSWCAFAALDIPFLLYGFYHKEKPIITTYTLWLIANSAVAIGAIIF